MHRSSLTVVHLPTNVTTAAVQVSVQQRHVQAVGWLTDSPLVISDPRNSKETQNTSPHNRALRPSPSK